MVRHQGIFSAATTQFKDERPQRLPAGTTSISISGRNSSASSAIAEMSSAVDSSPDTSVRVHLRRQHSAHDPLPAASKLSSYLDDVAIEQAKGRPLLRTCCGGRDGLYDGDCDRAVSVLKPRYDHRDQIIIEVRTWVVDHGCRQRLDHGSSRNKRPPAPALGALARSRFRNRSGLIIAGERTTSLAPLRSMPSKFSC